MSETEKREVRLTVAAARQRFSRILGQAAYAGQRTLICRRGYPMAALIPIRDLHKLQIAERAAQPDIRKQLDHLMRKLESGGRSGSE